MGPARNVYIVPYGSCTTLAGRGLTYDRPLTNNTELCWPNYTCSAYFSDSLVVINQRRFRHDDVNIDNACHIFSCTFPFLLNPRTYTQIHTPSVVQGRGRRLKEPLPRVFDMLQYLETILPSVESLWYSKQDEVYFMGGGAAGGLWRHQKWSRPWFLPRIRLKSR